MLSRAWSVWGPHSIAMRSSVLPVVESAYLLNRFTNGVMYDSTMKNEFKNSAFQAYLKIERSATSSASWGPDDKCSGVGNGSYTSYDIPMLNNSLHMAGGTRLDTAFAELQSYLEAHKNSLPDDPTKLENMLETVESMCVIPKVNERGENISEDEPMVEVNPWTLPVGQPVNARGLPPTVPSLGAFIPQAAPALAAPPSRPVPVPPPIPAGMIAIDGSIALIDTPQPPAPADSDPWSMQAEPTYTVPIMQAARTPPPSPPRPRAPLAATIEPLVFP